MYLLTGCLCGEDPAARSRPPCRAEGFQAESRVAGAGGMCAPAPAVFGSAPARGPLSMQKNALSPVTPFHRERETRLSPTAPSRRSAPGSGTQAGLPGENCQTAVDGRGGVKAQMPLGTGNLPIPDSPAPLGNSQRWDNARPGNSQQRDTARFFQGQNRQTVVDKERCQSANAARYWEAARSRRPRLAGEFPAAAHDPISP